MVIFRLGSGKKSLVPYEGSREYEAPYEGEEIVEGEFREVIGEESTEPPFERQTKFSSEPESRKLRKLRAQTEKEEQRIADIREVREYSETLSRRHPTRRLGSSELPWERKELSFFQQFAWEFEQAYNQEEQLEILNKYTNKLLHRGGWTRDRAKARLLQALVRSRKGEEEV